MKKQNWLIIIGVIVLMCIVAGCTMYWKDKKVTGLENHTVTETSDTEIGVESKVIVDTIHRFM